MIKNYLNVLISKYRTIKKIIFAFVVMPIFLALIAGEVYVRIFHEYITPELLKEKSLQYIPSLFSQVLFPEKKQIIEKSWHPEYIINTKGFRGKEFTKEENEGTIRIIIFGGSSVFDIYQPEGKDWPHQVEQLLNESGLANIEVINAGIPGHNTFDSFGRLFSDVWTLSPDFVVLYEAWNDIGWYFTSNVTIQKSVKTYSESEDVRVSYQSFIDKFLCEHSQLYVRLRDRYYNWKYDIGLEGTAKNIEPTAEITELGLKQFKLNLEMFADLANNIHATPILVTQARLVHKNNTPEEKLIISSERPVLSHVNLVRAYDKADEIIKEVSKSKKVHVIDAAKSLSGNVKYFNDAIHTSSEGSYQLAKTCANDLLELIKR